MLPSRGVENMASSVMRYARTSSGRKTIGGGMAVGGAAAALYGYSRNQNRPGPMLTGGAVTSIAGSAMLASRMR